CCFQFGLSIQHKRTTTCKFEGAGRELDERIRVDGGSCVHVPAVDSVDVGSKRHSTRTCVANKKGRRASVATQCSDPRGAANSLRASTIKLQNAVHLCIRRNTAHGPVISEVPGHSHR